MEEKYQKIINVLGKDRVLLNEPMADHTTFRIGGPADLFYEAKSEEELVRAIKATKEIGVPYFILGRGSNLLVGDKGFRGIVIKFQISNFKFLIKDGMVLVTVGAGMITGSLLEKLAQEGISGLEFMAGVPGSVGGAIRGNARAWQQDIGNKVNRVRILSEEGEILWLSRNGCRFSEKESRFKHNSEIILAIEFLLEKGDPLKIKEQIEVNLEKRSHQPKEPSAGCIFINPKPQLAGAMIDECGLKGTVIGGAKISEKHANFIVNANQAKAVDVVALSDLAREKVKEKFGVDLKEEIVRIGEF